MWKRNIVRPEEIESIIEEIDLEEALNQEDISDDDNDSSFSDYVDQEFEISSAKSVSDDDISMEPESRTTNVYIGKDGTEWNSLPMNAEIGKYRRQNIIRGPTHKVVLPPGKHINSVSDAFYRIVDADVINMIVVHTNTHGKNTHGTKWKPVDKTEVKAFIGLLLNAGLNKQGIMSYEEFWHPLFGCNIFRACMPKHRFVTILRHIRFDDKSSRSLRKAKDKFAPIRDMWERINRNLLKSYIPGAYLTIDEQLVPFRGRVSFRQYIPSKPDKYGLKIFWICDAETRYPLHGVPYLGQEGPEKSKNVAEKVVEELCKPFEKTNRNITFDNFFTSFELVERLFSKDLTCIGTLRKNKRCIPSNFLPCKSKQKESSLFGFRKNMTLVSYVPKKNKAVLLLSSLHHDAKTRPDDKNKPEIIIDYNKTKGGVDTLDQMAHSYSVKRKTNRWPLVHFYNLIDISGIAAFVIWINKFPEWNESQKQLRRKMFLKELIQELVVPNIKRRSLLN